MKIYVLVCLCIISQIFSIKPITPGPATKIPSGCGQGCYTAYNSELGSNNGVKGFSNCNDATCSNNEDVSFTKEQTGFARDVYLGVKWQCVEYARRWLAFNKNAAFASVGRAFQIFDMTEVMDLTTTNKNLPFASYKNKNDEAPKFGDLIIYAKASDSPAGHVGVIVNVNTQDGYFDVAEQNYNNRKWKDPDNYARRLKILQCDGKFVLSDLNYTKKFTLTADDCSTAINTIIGWKRVLEKSSK